MYRTFDTFPERMPANEHAQEERKWEGDRERAKYNLQKCLYNWSKHFLMHLLATRIQSIFSVTRYENKNMPRLYGWHPCVCVCVNVWRSCWQIFVCLSANMKWPKKFARKFTSFVHELNEIMRWSTSERHCKGVLARALVCTYRSYINSKIPRNWLDEYPVQSLCDKLDCCELWIIIMNHHYVSKFTRIFSWSHSLNFDYSGTGELAPR